MAQTFERDGVRLEYPDGWHREEEDLPNGWAASFHSPGTAFAMLSYHRDVDDPAELSGQALAALREDYPALDAEERVETIAGRPAVGHDIEFFSLDLVNACWTRALHGPAGGLLLLCQTADADRADAEPVLAALRASVRVDDDETAGG
ncbi:MAG TPA: hypothetical protein VIL46_08595 [Gemmataceae bacterium]